MGLSPERAIYPNTGCSPVKRPSPQSPERAIYKVMSGAGAMNRHCVLCCVLRPFRAGYG